jgi:hypothetical protein
LFIQIQCIDYYLVLVLKSFVKSLLLFLVFNVTIILVLISQYIYTGVNVTACNYITQASVTVVNRLLIYMQLHFLLSTVQRMSRSWIIFTWQFDENMCSCTFQKQVNTFSRSLIGLIMNILPFSYTISCLKCFLFAVFPLN